MVSEQQLNILLVDDRPENLLALEALLQPLGYHLIKARTGQEALRCVLQYDFAVILLDVQMPNMDGFETAELIRGRERSRSTPGRSGRTTRYLPARCGTHWLHAREDSELPWIITIVSGVVHGGPNQLSS